MLEVNPRASRTVPILSKVTGVPMVSAATRIMMGETLSANGLCIRGCTPKAASITVKAPVFSFSKLTTVDIFLGPEMKSTGEVMGTDDHFSCRAEESVRRVGRKRAAGRRQAHPLFHHRPRQGRGRRVTRSR